jgi:two-component system, response regulator YesN
MRVLIIDDETIVRTGLKSIIDWGAYGFDICGEADNGTDGLRKILEMVPDLVLLDIKMPGMYGVDVAAQARKEGFSGKILILTGYSDFEYAHQAIKSGVDAYLLKPIDEDELIEAVTRVKSKLDSELASSAIMCQSLPHMKNKIINDIICGRTDEGGFDELSLFNVDMKFDVFQVAVVESMTEANLSESKLRAELLREYPGEESNIDTVNISDRTVVLLKGSEAARQLPVAVQRMAERGRERLGGGLFIGVGRCVTDISDIHLSYRDACKILERRFFCDDEKNLVYWNERDDGELQSDSLEAFDVSEYGENLKSAIEIGDREMIEGVLNGIRESVLRMDVEPEKVITLTVNIYTQLKKRIQQSYPDLYADTAAKGMKSDMEIMNCVYGKNTLHEILLFLADELYAVAEKIGNTSGKNLMKKVENYIFRNYEKDLKLESIAQLFGYNSAYLGKMFKKALGDNFNTYLDKVRITEAKQLLLNENLKVYEISERVGFNNIDYFYKKFKHYVGQSPKEYRKLMGILSDPV